MTNQTGSKIHLVFDEHLLLAMMSNSAMKHKSCKES